MRSSPAPSPATTGSSNSTQPFVQLPANLLDAFIPGYSTFSSVLLETFGFDITLIVSLSFFAFALIKSIDFLQSRLVDLVMRFGTCEVMIAVSQLQNTQEMNCPNLLAKSILDYVARSVIMCWYSVRY